MTAREAQKCNGDGGGHERPEGQEERTEERTVSRRGRLIIVAAIVAAGVIDGVARAYLNLPSWDESDALMGRKLRRSERGHVQTLFQMTAPRAMSLESSFAAAGVEKGGEEGQGREILLGHEEQTREILIQRDIGGACEEHWNCLSWLICRDNECAPCESSHECQERHGSETTCYENVDEHLVESRLEYNVCKHKALMLPFDWRDLIIVVLTFVTIALSAPTGTGGGGILVPIYMAAGQFTANSAIPLSKFTILGGAIANNLINLQRRHPFANRPLIDFESIQLLVPNLLAGSIVGVLFNAVSPEWLLTILLVISLGWSGYTASKKAWTLYAEEARTAETEALMSSQRGERGSPYREVPATHYSFDSKDKMSAMLYEFVDEESKVNFNALGVVMVAWSVVGVCSWIKGGSGSERMVACGSAWFYLVALLPIPIIGVMSLRIANDVNQRFERKRALGYRFAEGDPIWSLVNVRQTMALSFFVGLAAGALGIAAGTILSPLLLAGGMNALVTVASTGMMVLFTASSTSIQYLILGRLQMDYAIVLSTTAFLASAFGNIIVHFWVRKYRKTWFVVFILALTIILSGLMLGYMGFYRTLRAGLQGEDLGWKDICNDRAHML